MNYDLIVIGGGPAGCAASISAARMGIRVLQLERGSFPRHKVCGEFVSAESLELLSQLLRRQDARFVNDALPINRVRIFIDGAQLAGRVNPGAASITRFDLDSALWQSATENGVDTRQNCPVRSVEGDGPFLTKTDSELFRAKAVINATGRWSNLTSSAVRAGALGERWIGIKAHFRELDPAHSVDLYFFEGGYCGVQPISSAENGHGSLVNACAMVRADVATDFAEIFRADVVLAERSYHWEPVMDPVTTSPLVFHEPELVNQGMLQAGDAATFVDPFIGDGISLALRSGALAAKSLAAFFRGECSLQQATAAYVTAYQDKLAHVHRRSARIRRLLLSRSIIRRPALSFLERAPAITSLLVRTTR